MSLFRSMGARKDATRGTAPIEVRKALAGLFAGPGVLPGAASPLVTGAASMAYTVGVANFVTTRGASDGVHLFGNDGSVLVGATGVGSTVPIAPGSGLSRIDIIWVRHPAAGENGDTTSEPVFGVASGVAAAPGLAPTIPVGALELARNTMTSGATTTASAGNNIAQTAAKAYLTGAAGPVSDAVAAASGLSSTGVATSRYGQAYIAGALTLTAATLSITGSYNQIGTVPVGFRPTEALLVSVMTSTGYAIQGQINTVGAVFVRSQTGTVTVTTGQSIPLAQFGPYLVA